MKKTMQRSKLNNGAAYLVCGDGEPVVLLHGVGLRAEAWVPQLEALASRWHVYAVDLPGHGQSSPLASHAELPEYVSWLRDVMELLDVGPVNIAGHSMGALIALGIAVEEPRLVRRVALLNGVCRRSPEASEAVLDRAEQIRCGKINLQQPLDRWFTDRVGEQSARLLTEEMLAGVDTKAYATAYWAFARGDRIYADRLPEIACPALFLTGDGDQNSTAVMAREMAATVDDGVAEIIQGHRHMVGLTAPDRVNNALINWLGREQRVQ